jgi:hypothetical protein
MAVAMAVLKYGGDCAQILVDMCHILVRVLVSVPLRHSYSHGASMGEVANGDEFPNKPR